MKLSKIILENKKVVQTTELTISDKDINTLTEHITTKLVEYLDIENASLLNKVVKAAIGEVISEE